MSDYLCQRCKHTWIGPYKFYYNRECPECTHEHVEVHEHEEPKEDNTFEKGTEEDAT